jgi:hypothetical protein
LRNNYKKHREDIENKMPENTKSGKIKATQHASVGRRRWGWELLVSTPVDHAPALKDLSPAVNTLRSKPNPAEDTVETHESRVDCRKVDKIPPNKTWVGLE